MRNVSICYKKNSLWSERMWYCLDGSIYLKKNKKRNFPIEFALCTRESNRQVRDIFFFKVQRFHERNEIFLILSLSIYIQLLIRPPHATVQVHNNISCLLIASASEDWFSWYFLVTREASLWVGNCGNKSLEHFFCAAEKWRLVLLLINYLEDECVACAWLPLVDGGFVYVTSASGSRWKFRIKWWINIRPHCKLNRYV